MQVLFLKCHRMCFKLPNDIYTAEKCATLVIAMNELISNKLCSVCKYNTYLFLKIK